MKKKVVEFVPDKEHIVEGIAVKPLDMIVPLKVVNEGNIYEYGYVPDEKRFLIHLQSMKRTSDGYEIGVRPEPFFYLYDGIDENVYKTFDTASDKVKVFNDTIKKNYIFHREMCG